MNPVTIGHAAFFPFSHDLVRETLADPPGAQTRFYAISNDPYQRLVWKVSGGVVMVRFPDRVWRPSKVGASDLLNVEMYREISEPSEERLAPKFDPNEPVDLSDFRSTPDDYPRYAAHPEPSTGEPPFEEPDTTDFSHQLVDFAALPPEYALRFAALQNPMVLDTRRVWPADGQLCLVLDCVGDWKILHYNVTSELFESSPGDDFLDPTFVKEWWPIQPGTGFLIP